MNIEIELAHHRVRISLRLEETKRYFEDYIIIENCDGYDVRVEDEDIPRYPLICLSGVLDPFSEAYLLMPCVSAYLLQFDCALIHGASFLWKGKSWLLTAPSGTGKSTQLHHWMKLYGEEIELINGDKNVLSVINNKISLYPSPWTGKELEAGHVSGPLGGIIVLKQADHNSMRRMTVRESVLEIFQQFLNIGDTAEEIRSIGKLTEKILENIPVWVLENTGDEGSAVLTHQILSEYEGA